MVMLPYSQAVELLQARGSSRRALLGTETSSLEEAYGRICAKEVKTSEELPAFANSAMDGFAVRSSETAQAGTLLKVVSLVAAGDGRELALSDPGVCVEIMTGARVPSGFDAIVRIEDTESGAGPAGEKVIRLSKPVEAGENLRSAGEDYAREEAVIRAGERVSAAHVMACAALGITHLDVLRRLRVGVVSTGKELVPYSSTPTAAQIRNSTLPYLLTRLQTLGLDIIQLGTIPDQPDEYLHLLKQSRSRHLDVIVSTGAVSVGKFDFVADILAKLEARIHFHKVAIRPGKPLLFAELPEGPAFFGVPGNPVSTAVGLRFFIEPYLRALHGLPAERKPMFRLRNDFKKPEGLRCFFKARLVPAEEHASEVEILPGQASFMIKPLTVATMWAILEENGRSVRAGDLIEAVPLEVPLGA